MKVVLFKPNEDAKVVELAKDHDYTDIKKLLEIDSPLTCIERKIGNKYFDIWCDDEGLLKDDKIVCGVLLQSEGQEILCGNLLIANHDEEGNTIGLSDKEIKMIMSPESKVSVKGWRDFNKSDEDEEIIIDYGYFGAIKVGKKGEWLIYGI